MVDITINIQEVLMEVLYEDGYDPDEYLSEQL